MAMDGQLIWRCRRGMRELDTLLVRYLDPRYPVADGVERQAFAALLELTDPELWAYVLGQQVPSDPEACRVIKHIAAAHPRA